LIREVEASQIETAVAGLAMEANYHLGQDVIDALRRALESETSPAGKGVLEQLLENASIASSEEIPMCQDTGFAVVFVELGQDVHIVGGNLDEAINAGVARGYTEGYLRKSILRHPIRGGNTGDNTPAIVHLDLVPGDQIKITLLPKGGGSENMSRIAMLKPADGVAGIKRFVVEAVRQAGPNPCPPLVVGVGVGGTFDKVAFLAKKALLRPLDERHPDPEIAQLEEELLETINKLGIGPQGLGGRTTALAVKVELFPRHIASFPVAVNIQCHACRKKETVL